MACSTRDTEVVMFGGINEFGKYCPPDMFTLREIEKTDLNWHFSEISKEDKEQKQLEEIKASEECSDKLKERIMELETQIKNNKIAINDFNNLLIEAKQKFHSRDKETSDSTQSMIENKNLIEAEKNKMIYELEKAEFKYTLSRKFRMALEARSSVLENVIANSVSLLVDLDKVSSPFLNECKETYEELAGITNDELKKEEARISKELEKTKENVENIDKQIASKKLEIEDVRKLIGEKNLKKLEIDNKIE